MDTTQHEENDERIGGGDLLVGADAIRAYLVFLGMHEEVDPYYLKRAGWPIGKSAAGKGGLLVASKRRLDRHTQKLAAPKITAA
jgi:hypothetical protein